MNQWIQIYSNLPQHKKTSLLAEKLHLTSAWVHPNVLAVGMLVHLWTWAIQNAYDGDLSDCSDRTIADACQWRKKPQTLVQALIESGWIDGEERKLHDWEEYAVLLMQIEEDRRQKLRDRVARYRSRRRLRPGGYGNVTDTPCNAPTRQDITKQDNTLQDKTGEEAPVPAEPDASTAPAEVEAMVMDFRRRINPAASQSCLDKLCEYAGQMGVEVCRKAVDIAVDAKKTSWPYVEAILRDKYDRGVRSLADWQAMEQAAERRRAESSAQAQPVAPVSEIGKAAVLRLVREAQ